MLESAKVTLDYNDLQELIEEKEELKNEIKFYKDMEESLDKEGYLKLLDKIEILVNKAVKAKTLKENREILKEVQREYCDFFQIPEGEFNE